MSQAAAIAEESAEEGAEEGARIDHADAHGGGETLGPDDTLLSPSMLARLAKLSMLARKLPMARRRGLRRTRRRGSGTDAIDKRNYVAGDDVRRIDWSAYARFERLLVRVVADEQPLRLGLLIDTSGSMAYGAPSKLRQAARVAAGLAAIAVGAEDRVAVVASGPRARAVTRTSGGQYGLRRLLEALEPLDADGPTDLAGAARLLRGAMAGRGTVVLLSDLWDPGGSLSAARVLRDLGHQVVLVRVLTPFERAPTGLDGVTLEDDETGELLELPPGGVAESYAAAFAEHLQELTEGCAELGAPLLDVDTDAPFDRIVAEALRSGVVRARSLA